MKLLRISLILTILSNGTKLTPLVVFKGKTGGPLEKELQNNLNIKNNLIYAKCQENSWVNNDIFKFWLFNIWFKYTNSQTKECLLIIDRATSHYIENLDLTMKKNNSLVPPGLTKFFQPLDISVNFPFKHYLNTEYFKYNIANMNTKKITQNNIINMICKIWYDENKISDDIIKKGFKVSGITEDFNQNQSKIKFVWPKEIIPKVDIKKYILENLEEKIEINSHDNYWIEYDFQNDEKEEKIIQPKITEIFVRQFPEKGELFWNSKIRGRLKCEGAYFPKYRVNFY